MAILAFFFLEGLFDHILGGDAGMVHTRHPEGFHALHAAHPGQGILNGVLQRVTHMQPARYVGRGHDDDMRILFRVMAGTEKIIAFPILVPFGLDGRRVVFAAARRRNVEGFLRHGNCEVGFRDKRQQKYDFPAARTPRACEFAVRTLREAARKGLGNLCLRVYCGS